MFNIDVASSDRLTFSTALDRRYLKVVIDGTSILYPRLGNCDASVDYQKWDFTIKNTYGLEPGTYANKSAVVQISIDLVTWYTIFTGSVTDEGVTRTIGYVTDDFVNLELTDPTRRKGTKRKPENTLLDGFRICDPSTPSSSILHYLANEMGVTLESSIGTIDYAKTVASLGEKTIWQEFQSLAIAFHADMYFAADGTLRFKSPFETGYSAPSVEWTFSGDPNIEPPTNGSWIKGKIEQTYTPIRCNKGKVEFGSYDELPSQVIYENTENYNADLKHCSIEIAPGEYWPGPNAGDKAQLKYKDLDTGEEYPYAGSIETLSIGSSASDDIQYSGGSLQLISFDGIAGTNPGATRKNPDSSEIILYNSGASTCEIYVFRLRGTPYRQIAKNTVEYTDPAITDEVDYVEQQYSNEWYTDASQAYESLQLKVEQGKSRYRRLGFSTDWTPWIQRGAPVEVKLPDSVSVTGKIISYAHRAKGRTLASMYTSVIVEETEAWVPAGGNPVIIQERLPRLSGRRGADGADGSYTVYQYAKNTSATTAPSTGWQETPPSIATGEYLWMRTGEVTPPAASPSVWSSGVRIKGDEGDTGPTGPEGPQGVQGPAGEDGQSLYTWIKYADDASGSGLSDSPTDKEYIGLAYNKSTPTESTNSADYTWAKIEGEQGVPGSDGSDGESLFTWIKYADDGSGTGMSDSPAGKNYIGLAYNKATATESTDPADYTWSLYKGPQGDTGPTGPEGLQGPQGDDGIDGDDGQSLHTWTAYADNSSGSGISLNPVGKPFIGFAYNKSSLEVDTSDPSIFTWTPFYSNLIASVIEILTGGAIRSNNYSPGNAGMSLNASGFLEVEDGQFRGILDNSALTTRQGSPAEPSVSFSSKTHWYTQNLYSAVRANSGNSQVVANVSYDGGNYSKIVALEPGEQIQISPTLSFDNVTSYQTDNSIGTVPVSGRYRIALQYSMAGNDEANDGRIDRATGILKLYENGVEKFSVNKSSTKTSTSGTEYYDVNLVAGRSYELYIQSDIAYSGIIYTFDAGLRFYTENKGIYCLNDASSFYIPTNTFLSHSSTPFSMSSPISWASAADYAPGNGFVEGLPSILVIGATYNASGSLSYDGSHTITGVMKTSGSSMIVYTDDGNYEFSSDEYYAASGSYEIQLQSEAVLTKTLLPKTTDAHDIGNSIVERFRNLFVQNINADSINLGNRAMYACRAWVNFDGTAITDTEDMTGVRASGNISSVVDEGIGDYTFNFTNSLPD
ncbi:MAG: collagen-like protein, partial [Spirochaetia bacterium]|nr:collagen-like protein [Spirochaetia bacterium]